MTCYRRSHDLVGENLVDGGTTQAEVAIVGVGAIGVALAVRLSDRVGRIALIEAGGTKLRPAHNLSFFKAEQIDDTRHGPTELYRRRMLGGTTSVWGGRCIPFDREDFAATPDRAGWPITFAEFDAHVPDALAFVDAGAPEFTAAAALPNHPVPLAQPLSDLVLDRTVPLCDLKNGIFAEPQFAADQAIAPSGWRPRRLPRAFAAAIPERIRS